MDESALLQIFRSVPIMSYRCGDAVVFDWHDKLDLAAQCRDHLLHGTDLSDLQLGEQIVVTQSSSPGVSPHGIRDARD